MAYRNPISKNWNKNNYIDFPKKKKCISTPRRLAVSVLEELMMQIGTVDDDEPEDFKAQDRMDVLDWDISYTTRCQSLGGQCDSDGKFLPTQCEENTCWCVDEAGNQPPNTNTFQKGNKDCSKIKREPNILIIYENL